MATKWTFLITIPSATSRGTSYGIDVNSEGELRCRCPSYIHSLERPKTCKHIQDPRTGAAYRQWERRTRPHSPTFIIGRIVHNRHPSAAGYVFIDVRASEPVSLVTERELRQAEKIISEARAVLADRSSYRFRALQDALEDLGRP